MRVGMNPNRTLVSGYRPARVTAAVLVNIPERKGYFHHRFSGLQLCLESMARHADAPMDLLVFDNGSCAEVVDYLRRRRDDGFIRYLLLSAQNIGKIEALRMIFAMAPGEIVAYSDDDIFFYPGWLSAHLKLLNAFPEAGMVSGWAIRHTFQYGNASCMKIAREDRTVRIERSRRLPDDWERDFAVCTGRDPEKYLAETASMEDIVLSRNGVEAYATADHFQFVAPKKIVSAAMPREWRSNLMGSMIELDEAIDARGHLRLATTDRAVRHMGNVLTPETYAEASRYGIDTAVPRPRRSGWLARRLFWRAPVRRLLRWAYDKIYWMLEVDSQL